MPRTITDEQELRARDARRKRLESISQAAAPVHTGKDIQPHGEGIRADPEIGWRIHTATAFRHELIPDVTSVITDYVTSYEVSCKDTSRAPAYDDFSEARIYEPVNGWTLVLWPVHFGARDFPLARAVAATVGWVLSTVHVHNDDYWEHLCCSGDEELHAFCSRPRYWRDDLPEVYRRTMAYGIEPSRLASALSVEEAVVQPYLVDVDALKDRKAKAHGDDQFPLGDLRVLIDFWRRLGIEYPSSSHKLAAVLRLGQNIPRLPSLF